MVGNATLDILHSVDHYPQEDEEIRATTQRLQRGGNAANTACVLAQHGHQVSFVGTLADDAHAQTIRADLTHYGVDLQYCQVITQGVSPLSCITLNQQTGSRTIVHYRDLPEYEATQFATIPLTGYDWFHFEGRNLAQTRLMLDHLHQVRVDQPISIEIEKRRPEIEQLFGHADVLLFSRAYALAHGCEDAAQLLARVRAQIDHAILVCSWGDQGAFANLAAAELLEASAESVTTIIDSVGAGDTFNAGLIHSLLSGRRLQSALAYANHLAAKKLRQYGFDNLVD